MKPAPSTAAASGGAMAPWIAASAVGACLAALDPVAPHGLLPQTAGYREVGTDAARPVLMACLAGLVAMRLLVMLARRVVARRWSPALATLAFGVCALLAGCSRKVATMAGARLPQGAAAGALAARLPSPGRSAALAAGAAALFAGSVGAPVLGGWVSDNFSPLWIFLAYVPLALLLAAILATAPQSPANT